ncbi:MAG: RidA family protein [Gammaproteobacteria bacterium]|nr:RidA family protein [Gammaproteobacteria bacterium]MBU2676599.1 RidA family protein [Gammaproteobacteria bacterium]NNL50334.1 RidA family protein [Woeseiaceae bacterium]
MGNRQNIHSGAPWEAKVGYSRAVRTGPHIAVSGTAPVGDDGEVVAQGDAYGQSKRCLEIIAHALHEAGAGLEHVVRTRMFVTDIEQWPDVARAHREAFCDVMPATTMVEVSRLIHPEMLVEIEAEAFTGDD